MIRQSFTFLAGIGRQQELNLWKQGIREWDDFLNTDKIKGISAWRKRYYNRKIREAKQNLYAFNSHYFYNNIPLNEHWRLYDFFRDDTVYLDIETNGITEHAYITVIGLFDGINTKIMIRDLNLNFNYLKNFLKNYKMIVTFNGSVFDLPFILKRHPDLMPKIPHFDLRFHCSEIGLNGGLKETEKKLRIKRNGIIERLYGGDALTLWRMYKGSGDDYYLKLLVEYNEEDCINLKQIAEHVYERLKNESLKTKTTGE